MALDNVTSHFSTMLETIASASFLSSLSIIHALTAEADRVLCQLVMFLTFFFHWMYKMKFRFYQESSVIHG